MAARISHSGSASESVGLEVLDGAGVIGDSTGITDTQCLAAADTSPGAERFITGAISPEEAYAAELTTRAAELITRAAELTTVPAQPPDLSTETGRRLEATLSPAVRVANVRAPSAVTTMANRQRAIRHAERPASVVEQRVAAGRRVAEEAEEDLVAVAAAGVINRSTVMFLVV